MPQSLVATEDQAIEGRLAAINLSGTVGFRVVTPPHSGRVVLDPASGAFRYEPKQDFFGADSFSYVAENPWRVSRPAVVALQVQNVDDLPTLAPIPDLQNSAYERDTRYVVSANDVDNEALRYSSLVHDPAVARAAIDPATGELTLEPLARGATAVTVEVRDGQNAIRSQFTFSVGDVTKAVSVANPERDLAVTLQNDADREVAFELTHNGFPMLGTDEQMAEYVRAMAPVIPDEPFERKLWRFARNNTYHWPPPSTDDRWINDPWVVISLGWGFCSQVAATYVRVARAAGYEARVYGLTGHVVPEIKIGERWQMFDPDLALYYRTRSGEIASVDDLVADPALITEPTAAVLDPEAHWLPYSDLIASFYASAADNYIADWVFVSPQPAPRPSLTLAPGATFVYPGRWTEPPTGYDGDVAYEVPAFVQGNLTTPESWTGAVPLSWPLAAVQGEGRVRLGEQEFDVGSPALAEALRENPLQYDHIEIIEARSSTHLVMWMNALRYHPQPNNALELKGRDVWAIKIATTALAEEHINTVEPAAWSKPRPIRP